MGRLRQERIPNAVRCKRDINAFGLYPRARHSSARAAAHSASNGSGPANLFLERRRRRRDTAPPPPESPCTPRPAFELLFIPVGFSSSTFLGASG
eukprot:scaffold5012_cov25-Tisochrysis_lutea.AAC.2